MGRQLASALTVGVFAVLAMGSTDGGSPPDDTAAAADSAAAPAPASTNTHFAHGTLNVRSGPGQGHRVLRKLQRGDTLSLGEPDANGWARVLGADSGYVSTRVGLLRTDRPAEVPAYAEAGECAEAMRAVHTRMNRRPDAVKEFREKELREVTWWYRERPRDLHPRYQFSFLTGPYTDGCRTSELES
jgi:hypothetical protein